MSEARIAANLRATLGLAELSDIRKTSSSILRYHPYSSLKRARWPASTVNDWRVSYLEVLFRPDTARVHQAAQCRMGALALAGSGKDGIARGNECAISADARWCSLPCLRPSPSQDCRIMRTRHLRPRSMSARRRHSEISSRVSAV